jgi:hypothetical protein
MNNGHNSKYIHKRPQTLVFLNRIESSYPIQFIFLWVSLIKLSYNDNFCSL